MNLHKILAIYKKELLDLFRDKRTVISSIVIPLVLYPVIIIGFSSLMMRQETKLGQQTVHVIIEDLSHSEISGRIYSMIDSLEYLEILPESENNPELLRNNSIQAVVTVRDSLRASGYQTMIVNIAYNEANEKSEVAFRKLRNGLNEFEKIILSERLISLEINEDLLEIVDLKEENIAPPEQMLGFVVGRILPYLLIVLVLSGGAVVASDLVAGEKERKTLETILVSAAKRIELIIGKYLTIITISFITVLMNLFSMYISLKHIISQSGVDTSDIQLPLSNFGLILIALLPLVTLMAAVMLSISTYARNIKEAQSYQMPIMFGGMMLAMISMLPGFELTVGFALIPIINFSLLFKEIMMGNFDLFKFLIVIGSTIALDVVAILFSLKLFNKESVLFRTAEEKSLKFWGKDKKNVLSPQIAFLFFLLVLLALFYQGTAWQSADISSGLIKTQIFIILLPTILLLRISRSNIKSTIGLNQTEPVNFLLTALMAIPMIIIAVSLGELINLVFPISQSYLERMQELLTVEPGNLLNTLLLLAVLPGICEETMFRGYILSAFRKSGFSSAIIISALLFGILHLDPFRLIPVTLLGAYLGFLMLRSNSIYIPMFAHFLNNGLAVLITNFGNKIPFLEYFFQDSIRILWLLIPSIFVMYVLLKLYNRLNFNQQVIGED